MKISLSSFNRRPGLSRPPVVFLWICLAALVLPVAACLPDMDRSPGGGPAVIHWQGRVDIERDLVLPAESTLVIAPGTQVVFHPVAPADDPYSNHPYFPGAELIVRGRIIALGTADRPIIFRAADENAPAGSWGGVNIEASPRAEFDYCVFRGADSAIHARESSVYLEHSVFRRNHVGVRFHSSEILIENNLFTDNGAGIRFHFGAPVICRNRFENNRRSIFITAHPENVRIENNNFISAGDYHLVLGEEVPENIDAARNWWGTVDVGQIEPMLYDGRREPHLGKVRLLPVLQRPAKGDVPWIR
ncbi:MAG: right-handed parallel beta-helix repeat-containing protein [Deltaproteobacteria bacterium]|nr:MAG: right-handed parallel beta-helix repeat-containing protein [Deltaproteobacteria bacterium]